MSLTAIVGGGLAALVLLIGWLVKRLQSGAVKQGKAEVHAEVQKKMDQTHVDKADEVVKQVEEVREVEHRLNTDPAYAERVRNEFSRD